MTVSSVATGYDGISLLAGNTAYDPAAIFLIERKTLASATTSITFSSIPSTYKHIQIRYNVISATASNVISLRLNGDTAANYRYHMLYGNNGTVTATGAGSAQSQSRVFGVGYGTITTYPNVGIIDVHDYISSTKNKTVRILSGADNNTTTQAEINLNSGLWMSTTAVTSLTLFSGVNFNIGSTFALYGMVG
jgi:hypothetical protein